MGRKRVVAYVRVSSSSKAQLHSYEFQEQYWRSKFENDPDNELVRIYADRGISGSDAYKRPEFMTMLKDARNRKFDVIHTKSVSRFARNTVQLLEAVRELRDLGIEVIFEKEQISTLQPTSELFLTIAATIAENDLEVDSQRQKWSFQHRFENGWYSIGSSMYGYRMTGDNKVVVVPEEAEVIRWVYDMYLSGCGCPTIARVLNEAGIKTGVGMPWRASGILKMISNEKYMGDVMMGKSVNIDGKKCNNLDGQYGERYYIEDAHEGIISKETYYKAMELRQQRANPKLVNQDIVEYPFTRRIACGCCGSYFRHKVNNPGKKWANDIWICARQEQKGKAIILTSVSRSVAPIVVCFLSLFPILYTAFLNAIKGVPSELEEMCLVYKIPLKKRVFSMYIPQMLPKILLDSAGGFSFALKLVVSAEILASVYGSLGGIIQEASIYLLTSRLFALTLAVCLIGIIVEFIGKILSEKAGEKLL